jgi:hypothetical protein
MKKQTAVEWLVANIDWQLLKNTSLHYEMIVNKAKEMEREQIIDAFYNARKNKSDCQIWNCEGSQKAYETFNQYYNETFNP